MSDVLNKLAGYKTYLAAAGFVLVGLSQYTAGDYTGAYQSFAAALAAAGLRHALDRPAAPPAAPAANAANAEVK